MRAVVAYESLFGNTRRIAEAIGAGLGEAFDVRVTPAPEASADELADAELLVVGAPTHAFGVPSRRTREGGIRDADPEATATATGAAVGARELIADLAPGNGLRVAAAFDTRMDKPRLITGAASRGLTRMLRRRGYRIAAPPQSFLVAGFSGPLATGELARARAWGVRLAAVLAAEPSRS